MNDQVKVYEKWMKFALIEAIKAYDSGEVPIGAIIVKDSRIIGKGYNQIETLNDATAHAEMIAVTSASSTNENWRLDNSFLFVTKEPCPMCAGAIVNSRIEFLYFGCYDEDYGACGSKFEICGNVSLNTPAVVKGNLLAGESLALLQEYFFKKRQKKKNF